MKSVLFLMVLALATNLSLTKNASAECLADKCCVKLKCGCCDFDPGTGSFQIDEESFYRDDASEGKPRDTHSKEESVVPAEVTSY